MDRGAALELIRALAAVGDVRLTDHAAEQARVRGYRFDDVRRALEDAESCMEQENGRWCVLGVDLDEEPLTLICEIEDEVIVVTLFATEGG